jgi:uncharacterized protein YigA (DUF484 family)
MNKKHTETPLNNAPTLSTLPTDTMTSELDFATVATYLLNNPLFFQEHRELLAKVKLSSPLTGRAISLQERQMEVMRTKYKALEMNMADLIRMAQENDAISGKFHQWIQSLLLARNDIDLPHTLIDGLRTIFSVPYASLRMWRVAPDYNNTWFVQNVSDDVKTFAHSLGTPYCGPNNDFEPARWLQASTGIESVAILPLRVGSPSDTPEAFGLLILGSPDAERFSADMATDFLIHINETASAALACLLD